MTTGRARSQKRCHNSYPHCVTRQKNTITHPSQEAKNERTKLSPFTVERFVNPSSYQKLASCVNISQQSLRRQHHGSARERRWGARWTSALTRRQLYSRQHGTERTTCRVSLLPETFAIHECLPDPCQILYSHVAGPLHPSQYGPAGLLLPSRLRHRGEFSHQLRRCSCIVKLA